MTYVLLGEAGEFRVPAAAWRSVIALAGRYGWEPLGTVRQVGWSGCYVTPAGQMVTPRDAALLARALEDAALDVPEHDARPESGVRRASWIEAFSGAARQRLLALVEFLRQGPFLIHVTCGRH